MVLTKATYHNSNRHFTTGIREVVYVAMPLHETTITKTHSRRKGELPSLRYGSLGSKNSITYPLRVTNLYHSEPLSYTQQRSNGKNLNILQLQPETRRVRFNLPPTESSTNLSLANTTAKEENARVARRLQDHQVAALPAAAAAASGGRRHVVKYPAVAPVAHSIAVNVTASTGGRVARVHPTARYIRGTLSPTANATTAAPPSTTPGGQLLLKAARDTDDAVLREILRRANLVGISENDLNAVDSSGRSVLSYIASNGTVDILEQILLLPGLDANKADNEGNSPLHFAAQAGQSECLNCMLTRCKRIEIDARNNLGFTPLMKAALQGRNKCAKILLFAGANPTLRDNGRGLRADQWARFCGRYVCADVIEKHARQRLLERSTSYGNWAADPEISSRNIMGKLIPVPPVVQTTQSNGIKSKLRKVFRTSSGPGNGTDHSSSARLVTQLTSAALCASSPALPAGPTVPPVVKSLIRPLTVPRLQITLVSNGDLVNNSLNKSHNDLTSICNNKSPVIKQRTKKKK